MKKYILIFIVAFVLFYCMAFIRFGYITLFGFKGGYDLSSFIGFFVFTIATFILLRRSKNQSDSLKILLTIVLGVSILDLPIRLFNLDTTQASLGSYLAWLFGILTGYLIYRIKWIPLKILISTISIATIIWFSYIGYPMWMHQISFGSFTGRTEQVVETPIVFQDSTGSNIALNDFSGKYLVLDFWSMTCGVCFEKFPQVQKIYDALKETDNVELYSIFCRRSKRDETPQKGVDILQKRGYTFPTLSLDMDNPILKEIGVDGFPTVIIFDTNGKLIFRGNIESAVQYVNKLIK